MGQQNLVMQQQQFKFPIKRKSLIKSTNNKLNKRRKNNNSISTVEQNYTQDQKRYPNERQQQKNIGQNISLIAKKQEGSFISYKQDQSLDSFDKMIIGVDEQLDIEEDNTSNSKDQDINYTLLYREFQKLVKNSKLFKNDSGSGEIEQQNDILQEELFQQDDEKLKQSSSFDSNSFNIRLLRQKLEQAKDIRKQKSINASDQNISLRMLGANLSQIHEQEIQHNTSMNRMDPIEEEFIDFVSKNNEASKINISKIQKNTLKQQIKANNSNKNELNNSIKQPEEDEVVAMLENQLGSRRQNLIQEQSLLEESVKDKGKNQFFTEDNYHQILRELDDNQDKKPQTRSYHPSLIKRQEWINTRNDRTTKWKIKQMRLLNKMKQILNNPYFEFSDDQDLQLEL